MWYFQSMSFIANFTVFSMEFPITNCLPFFFQIDRNFCQIILSNTLSRGQNESLIKKIQISSEIKLLEGLKCTIVLIQREIISM